MISLLLDLEASKHQLLFPKIGTIIHSRTSNRKNQTAPFHSDYQQAITNQ
jgi:hypothetical protein